MALNSAALVFWTIMFTDGSIKEVYTNPGLSDNKPDKFYTYVKGDASYMEYVKNPYADVDGTLLYIWEPRND